MCLFFYVEHLGKSLPFWSKYDRTLILFVGLKLSSPLAASNIDEHQDGQGYERSDLLEIEFFKTFW